jgi:hypothetical protein
MHGQAHRANLGTEVVDVASILFVFFWFYWLIRLGAPAWRWKLAVFTIPVAAFSIV